MIEHYLRAFCLKDQSDWPFKLILAQFAYNSAEHSTTRESPASLLLGFHPLAPGQNEATINPKNAVAADRVK